MHDFHSKTIESSRESSVPELAKRLGRSILYAQALIRTGRIPGPKNGRGWVTTAAAGERYLAKHSALQTYARSLEEMRQSLDNDFPTG
jgi:hypothetical protein